MEQAIGGKPWHIGEYMLMPHYLGKQNIARGHEEQRLEALIRKVTEIKS